MLFTSFLERFVQTFIAEPFRQLADQTGWRRRLGKSDPFEFITSLVFGPMSALRQTLSSQAQSLSQTVTRQALDQRFTPQAVEFLKASFAHVLTQTLDWSAAHPQAEALRANFSALYLLDSSGFDCPATLQDIFPACGGAGSAANVKILLRYELIAGRLQPLEVLAGKRSDQGQALQAAQRRGLRESMRKQGRTPSAKALQLARWLLLLTNAPEEKLPAVTISYVDRLRWQVELIFRQAKSVLRLDQTESANPCRVQSEIWARLICAVLLFSWHAHASAKCGRRYQCEASFEKLIRMMPHWGHTIARAFLGGSDVLRKELRALWHNLLVNARKGRQKSRPTTWENLFNLWLDTDHPCGRKGNLT